MHYVKIFYLSIFYIFIMQDNSYWIININSSICEWNEWMLKELIRLDAHKE